MMKNDELAKNLKSIPTHGASDHVASDPAQEVSEEKPKKKIGRPRKYPGETKAINFKISEEMKEQIDIAVRGSTRRDMADYITNLIQKDLDANLDKYKARIAEDE